LHLPVSLAEFGRDEAERWENVALRYRGPLRGFFSKRVRDPADVDDMIQDVFMHLIRRAQGGPIERVEQYIFQTAANVLRDSGRRRQARESDAHESLDEEIHQLRTEISPERVVLGRESVARVAAALRELPQRTRDVFVLRSLEKRKYAEIADLLCISTRAAEKHMAKALTHLGRVLDDVK
jgi:RNA polymerase sigma factor (sigma-70 family)